MIYLILLQNLDGYIQSICKNHTTILVLSNTHKFICVCVCVFFFLFLSFHISIEILKST